MLYAWPSTTTRCGPITRRWGSWHVETISWLTFKTTWNASPKADMLVLGFFRVHFERGWRIWHCRSWIGWGKNSKFVYDNVTCHFGFPSWMPNEICSTHLPTRTMPFSPRKWHKGVLNFSNNTHQGFLKLPQTWLPNHICLLSYWFHHTCTYMRETLIAQQQCQLFPA